MVALKPLLFLRGSPAFAGSRNAVVALKPAQVDSDTGYEF